MVELRKYTKSIVGIDINAEGINFLKNEGFDVECLNIMDDIPNRLYEIEWDIIILSHVIEHVPNFK